MGGPDSLKAVRPFLYNLFSDRELIQLPAGALLQKPFAWLISRIRAPKVRVNYAMIGGRSPLLEWTEKQAQGAARELGEQVKPYVAMRYWKPRAEECLRRMKQDDIKQAVVLSMYPHYTNATTGSSIKDSRRSRRGSTRSWNTRSSANGMTGRIISMLLLTGSVRGWKSFTNRSARKFRFSSRPTPCHRSLSMKAIHTSTMSSVQCEESWSVSKGTPGNSVSRAGRAQCSGWSRIPWLCSTSSVQRRPRAH